MAKTTRESVAAEGFSIAQASKILGCADRTTNRLVARREIRHYRIGRRVFIPRSAIDEFIQRNSVATIDAKAIARELIG